MIKGILGLIVVSDTMNDDVAVKMTDIVALNQEVEVQAVALPAPVQVAA
tara:strand:- start:863 stop:1009 length:147 start_codon:yes stop_codon:yes gene_type:complete